MKVKYNKAGKPVIPKGYRKLKRGTIRQRQDKFASVGEWVQTLCDGEPISKESGLIYIRKVK